MPENAVPPSGNSRIPLLIGGIAVAAVGGFALGWQMGGQKAAKENYDKGYAAAQADDRRTLEERGVSRPSAEEIGPMLSLAGKVTSVAAGSFTVRVRTEAPTALDEPFDRDVVVTPSAEASILLQRRMTPAEALAAREAYDRALAAAAKQGESADPVEPPRAFIETPATLADLKVGMAVNVTSDQDVNGKTSIAATIIRIVPVEEAAPVESAGPDEGAPEAAPQP
jgi:hypothetical protein